MFKPWRVGNKSGNIQFTKGEVVYQYPKGRVNIEVIYETEDGKRYIHKSEGSEELIEVTTNPFNGYCYRQDGE